MATFAESVYSIVSLEAMSLILFELPEDLLLETPLFHPFIFRSYPAMVFPLFSEEHNCFLVFE